MGAVQLLRHEVTAEVILDPPEHVRLPIADDEIIDRAVVVQSLSRRVVTLLTYDTSLAMRGRRAGLAVVKLDKPAEGEPS